MDVKDLRVDFLRAYEAKKPLPDGFTQRDKRLPYFSVVYPIQGYYALQIEEEPPVIVPPNGCFLVPPGVRHTLIHRSDTGFLLDRWLFFSVSHTMYGDITAHFRPPVVRKGAEALPFRQLVDEALTPARGQQAAFRDLSVAGRLLEQLVAVSVWQNLPDVQKVAPAVELMRRDLHRHLTVTELAGACGMSEPHFFRSFRAAFGVPPMAWLMTCRLQAAARLLLSDAATLSAVAAATGFCDEFHLSRSFKRYYGRSPKEYRQKQSV